MLRVRGNSESRKQKKFVVVERVEFVAVVVVVVVVVAVEKRRVWRRGKNRRFIIASVVLVFNSFVLC